MRTVIAACGLLSALISTAFSQTPGMIFEPATGGGAAILDPNGDGYTSQTTAGFITDDQAESEIPFNSLVFPELEPTSDLAAGPNCSFTDFVDEGDEDPVQSYVDGGNNWLFRMRMGRALFNAKSYSILIDSDGLFGNSGPDADPDFTEDNPGFEIEIVLATKFGVFAYDIDAAAPTCAPVLSYPGTTNYQKSIALTTNCADPDYFYDFYISFTDLTTQFGILPTTPMRLAIVDNMAAQKSTVCNPNSASDIAGVDDANCGSLSQCLSYVIDNYPPCPLDSMNTGSCTDRSKCPAISNPIATGATTVSGSSVEADGTVIEVFKNGVSIGTTIVTGGVWSLTGIAPALASNDTIIATALAAGETLSKNDCNESIVGSTCAPPVTSIVNSSAKGFCGTGIDGATIRIYHYGPGGKVEVFSTPAYSWDGSGNFLWKCNGNGTGCSSGSAQCLCDGAYAITQTLPGQCESSPVWACIERTGGASACNPGTVAATATPSIDNVPLSADSTVIRGSIAPPDTIANVTILVYVNGKEVGTTLTTASGNWTLPGLSLNGCDTVHAVAINSANSQCASPNSNVVTVNGGITDPPSILGTYCTSTAITTVGGISTGADGTIIQVFENGLPEGSTTTVTNGVWLANTGINIAIGSTITATATDTSSCKTVSPASTGIVVGALTVDGALAITSSPITEGDPSVSGSATNGNTVQLYIDGFPIGAPQVVAGGIWTVPGIASELYPTGLVTATSSAPGGCESATAGPIIVDCIPPTLTLAVNPFDTTICTGSVAANVRVVNSQAGVIYQLTDAGINSGSSVLGNGATITLTSATLTDTTYLRVKAVKIPIGTCSDTLTDSVRVYVNAIPDPARVASATNNPICNGDSTNIEVALSQTNMSYQLRRQSDDVAIGGPVAGTGGTISMPTGPLAASTQFYIQVNGVAPSFCEDTLSTRPTITVNNITNPAAGPDQNFDCTDLGTLAGNTPVFGTGAWNTISGVGSVTTPTDPVSGVTGIGPGTFELEWVITVAGCTPRRDTVLLNRNNCAPVVDNEILIITEDTPGGGDLTDGGDSDYDGTPLTANTTPVSGPSNGGVVINPNGTYTYTPNSNYVGRDTIVVEICDAGLPLPGICVNDTVFIVVQGDFDADGIPDLTDIDDDNDGIPDLTETGGLDPNVDSDSDDIPDWRDPGTPGFVDTNGDNVDDRFDTDLDGVPDMFDIDADNDGIADGIEGNGGTVPAGFDNATGMFTGPVGANGMPDNSETAVDNGVTVLPLTNTDGTGGADYQDIDADDDGIPDLREAQPTVGFVSLSGVDADGNGRDDAYDGAAALTPVNTDGTTVADYLDTDSDDDGVPDLIEGHDANMDGIADISPAGTDTDGDGLDDNFDTLPLSAAGNPMGSNAPLQDTDGDAFSGGDRDWRDTDDDNDGILTANEDFNTNSNWSDDFTQGGSPTPDYLHAPDHDNDGIPDFTDIDDDNDGIPDLTETGGLDPNADANTNDIPDWMDPAAPGFTDLNGDNVDDRYDRDMDGVPNHFDIDADNDGIADGIEGNGGVTPANFDNATGMFTGVVGSNGMPDFSETAPDNGTTILPLPNSDGTGGADYQDIDADDDGIVDIREAQLTISYVLPSGIDADGNGRDDVYDGAGALSPINTDGTTVADYLDGDSDDDGVPDFIEGHDLNMDGIPDVSFSGTDTDGDGLDDVYDNQVVSAAPLLNSTGSNAPVQNTDGVDDRDWRDTDDDNDGFLTSVEDFNTNSNWADDFTQGGSPTPDYLFYAPFPVEWLSFEAELDGRNGQLSWATASESNSKHFEVERSPNGQDFVWIGELEAGGSTNEVRNYQFVDVGVANIGLRLVYYRLRQVDLNGSYSFSKVLTLGLPVDGQGIGAIYPNPASGHLNLDFFLQDAAQVQISLVTVHGQVLPLAATRKWEAGWQKSSYDISGLAAGAYVIHLQIGTKSYRKQLRVIR